MSPSSPRPPLRVVVVGAGIAGLAAAQSLGSQRPDVEVVVLEGSDRPGGKLRLAEIGGVTLDVGAEAMLNRRPEAVGLTCAAGLGDRLVYPATTVARVWSRGRLHRMPRSLMGLPIDADDLADSGILSPEGLARAVDEPSVPPSDLTADVGIGGLVESRYGAEVLDRLVEPLLGGVYAGHARELSVRAALPQVVAALERSGSVMRDAEEGPQRPDTDVPVFAGIDGGIGQLPEALAQRLDVRTGTTVRELARTPDGRWEVVTGPAPAPTRLVADAVVVAVPASAAARLVSDVAPPAGAELAAIEHASMAVVTLAYPAAGFPEVDGSGFLVPPVDGRFVKASTYSFMKWSWVRHASTDLVFLRASVGRHREEQQLQVPDEELVEGSVADLAEAAGIGSGPVDWQVQRWGGGLPQYAVGHLDRVRRVREAVGAVPGLAVCGAAYDGIGIPACISSADKAVQQVLDHLVTTLEGTGE